MVPFRMGVLKWTALDISRFGVVVTPIGSLTSQWFVVPWIKKVGNQTAFQVGTVLGCLGWTLCGQCWRLFGVADRSAVVRTGAIYVGLYIANLLGSGWPGAPAACQHSIRAMVLKQGIDVTDAGRGELNAACESSTPPSTLREPVCTLLTETVMRADQGLGLSIGVVMPYFWGWLYAFFLSPPPSAPAWLRLGGGAHMGIAGLLYLASSLVLAMTPKKDLFLEDGQKPPPISEQPWRKQAVDGES